MSCVATSSGRSHLKELDDSVTDMGTTFARQSGEEFNVNLNDILPQAWALSRETAEQLRNMLEEPDLKRIEAEYHEVQGQKEEGHAPQWYYLFEDKSEGLALDCWRNRVAVGVFLQARLPTRLQCYPRLSCRPISFEPENGSAEV